MTPVSGEARPKGRSRTGRIVVTAVIVVAAYLLWKYWDAASAFCSGFFGELAARLL